MKSTNALRINNNVMRHKYRVLSEAEKSRMQAIKDMGDDALYQIRFILKSQTYILFIIPSCIKFYASKYGSEAKRIKQ